MTEQAVAALAVATGIDPVTLLNIPVSLFNAIAGEVERRTGG